MISLKELWAKSIVVFRKIKARYEIYKNFTIKYLTIVSNAMLKAYRFTSYVLSKLQTAFQLLIRKIYVWKILSVRNKWYQLKNGGLYNPKLKATIYPSWQCTWTLAKQNENLSGLESKESAQDIAFKLWMKKRRLKDKLEITDIKISLPPNLSPKILSNKIYIRKASTKDAPELLTVMKQLGYSEGDESMIARIQTYAYSTNNHIFVAERGKKIVGFVAFVIYDLFASSGTRCHIEELVAGNQPSDLSIKRKLLEAIEDFARDNNGKIIDLTTGCYRVNDPNNDFYKYLGYDNDNFTTKMYLKKEL